VLDQTLAAPKFSTQPRDLVREFEATGSSGREHEPCRDSVGRGTGVAGPCSATRAFDKLHRRQSGVEDRVDSRGSAFTVDTALRTAAQDADVVEVVRGAGEAGTRLADLLVGVRNTSPDIEFSLATLRAWCPQLARYSFHTLGMR
jgi:hypothetical protein